MTHTYIGLKIVDAWPSKKDVTLNKVGADVEYEDGYAVKYEDGYISWSPKAQFEAAYQRVDNNAMSFSSALHLVRNGGRVARKGWNGKNMFIFLVGGSKFTVNREPLLSILGEGTEVDYHGHIDMRTADGQIVPWLASQTDMLADDWAVVE